MQFDITATIVTYNNDIKVLQKAMDSFLNTSLNVLLYIVDNSENDALSSLGKIDNVEYIHNNRNLGFGKGHNVVLKDQNKVGIYHLILNPDVYFHKGVLEELFNYMQENTDVGNIMPKVKYPNGEEQFLCKMLPTPFDFFIRRFLKFIPFIKKHELKYELRFWDHSNVQNIPYLSGCFMFLRSSIINEIGGFDDDIFMYVEDTDLSRRIYTKYKNIFYPKVSIYHEFGKGSHKNFKLLWYSIKGAYVYFNKYGWFFDRERRLINKRLLKELKYLIH